MASSDSLETLYSWSFNSNNLLSVSLMHDKESKYRKYFCFLNIIPGIKNPDGTRSYDFKQGINFKLEPIKLFELYQVINAYVKGQMQLIGKYAIINDSSKSSYGNGGGIKTMYVNYQGAQEDGKGPAISLVAKYGQQGHSVALPVPSALGAAEMFKLIFERYAKLDMDSFSQFAPQPKTMNNSGQSGNTKPSENFVNFSNEDAPF